MLSAKIECCLFWVSRDVPSVRLEIRLIKNNSAMVNSTSGSSRASPFSGEMTSHHGGVNSVCVLLAVMSRCGGEEVVFLDELLGIFWFI